MFIVLLIYVWLFARRSIQSHHDTIQVPSSVLRSCITALRKAEKTLEKSAIQQVEITKKTNEQRDFLNACRLNMEQLLTAQR